ncbi:hypothetical protein THAOC_13842 [Thalassiosira oceanica]|uniref:Uncharacterized protein n=1 Tax=Thalassiosira oceanica TaxID=159749 RepID=K0T4L4_THAOC|nr:hypothetical protein THAOC_13842 [Thalassiosira oceanica]|eukprot:EJK65307.1 hypothetical protein THAOC_13842 [Thalassiosira oceanica]
MRRTHATLSISPVAGKNQHDTYGPAEMKALGKLLLIIYVFRDGRTHARIVGGKLDPNNVNHVFDALNLSRTSNDAVSTFQPQPHPSGKIRAPIADAQVFTDNNGNNRNPARERVSLSAELVVSEGVESGGSVSLELLPRQNASDVRQGDLGKHSDHRQLETNFKDLEDTLQEIARKDPREWTAAEWLAEASISTSGCSPLSASSKAMTLECSRLSSIPEGKRPRVSLSCKQVEIPAEIRGFACPSHSSEQYSTEAKSISRHYTGDIDSPSSPGMSAILLSTPVAIRAVFSPFLSRFRDSRRHAGAM